MLEEVSFFFLSFFLLLFFFLFFILSFSSSSSSSFSSSSFSSLLLFLLLLLLLLLFFFFFFSFFFFSILQFLPQLLNSYSPSSSPTPLPPYHSNFPLKAIVLHLRFHFLLPSSLRAPLDYPPLCGKPFG
jgi:hypothetical protein